MLTVIDGVIYVQFQTSDDLATHELERHCEPSSEMHSDVHRHWEGWEAR